MTRNVSYDYVCSVLAHPLPLDVFELVSKKIHVNQDADEKSWPLTQMLDEGESETVFHINTVCRR